jgi:lipase chaperone LimK
MRLAVLALGVAALASLAWEVHAPAGTPKAAGAMPDIATAASSEARANPAAPLAVWSAMPAQTPANPRRVLRDGSLRGTMVDGSVTVGFAGQVQPDPALRRLFDYYLSLLGETDLAGIRQLLREDLRQRPIDAGQQATVMQLFARYVAYQQARTALAAAGANDLGVRLAQDRAMRQRLLGPALAQAFYPTADADDARLLRQLAHIDSSGGAGAQDEHALTTVDATIQTQTDQLAAQQRTPEQLHAERAATWGNAAADRLAALDRQRTQWQQRLAAFAAQATALQRDPSLDDPQRRATLQQLLDQQFQGPQRLQAQAMWQAGLLRTSR